MHADLAGDDEQHGRRRRDEPPVQQEGAAQALDDGYLLQGEGDVAVARRAAHRQQHEDERQLIAHDSDHRPGHADARKGRTGGRAAQDDGQRGYRQQVEDDYSIRRASEGLQPAQRDEQRRHDKADEADIGRRKEGHLRGVGRDYGLLAQQFEEVIGGLEHRGADALLHAGQELPVHAGQPESEHAGEQKTGENEDIYRFYQYFHLSSTPLHECEAVHDYHRKGRYAPEDVIIRHAAVRL